MVILILLFILVVCLMVLMVRNEIVYRNRDLVRKSIFAYHKDRIEQGLYFDFEVDYSDMEEYEKTLFRLWDWGYKRILPKGKYEIIKEYIQRD